MTADRAGGEALRARDERLVKAEALIDFANAHRIPQVLFRGPSGEPITVNDMLRQEAERLIYESRTS